MNAKLVVVKGAKKATIRLRLPTVIGRSPEAAVKVPSTLVSRRHCEIVRSGQELVVRDLGSANGTFVNEERIAGPTLLFEDDLLRVGPVVMRIALDEGAQEEESVFEKVADDDEAIGEREQVGGAGASSIVSYRETDDGSFVGIEDDLANEVDDEPGALDTPTEGQDAVDALGRAAGKQQAKAAGKSALKALDGLVEKDAPKVDGGDSALGDFFKHLG